LPYQLLERDYDALTVGDAEVTRARTITEADVVAFCTLTGDMFALHTDRVAAERSLFRRRIVPGMLVLAYSYGLGVPPGSSTILANYGTDALRFPAPTFIDDTIHLEAAVEEKRERDARGGIVTLRWDVVNQNGTTVCASKLLVLVARSAA